MWSLFLAAAGLFAGLGAGAVPASADYCVTGVAAYDTLNVRAGPSTDFHVVYALRPGQCGISEPYGCRGYWCKIRVRGKRGWVNAYYLREASRSFERGAEPRQRKRDGHFDGPEIDGHRLDARMRVGALVRTQETADEFCKENGYAGMVEYAVTSAATSIAMGDGHVFRNAPDSNTAYDYIVCQ